MKINVLKAMREYENEQARLAEEMMEEAQASTAFSTETDPLWDCWFDAAFMYEPECDKDAEENNCTEQESTISYHMPVKDRAKRAERRKATAKHKRKISRNVTAIWGNYGKRADTDMQNWSYQKQKNGERRTNPKSQENKADQILKKAMKIGAVPENLVDTIYEHLEWLKEYGKRNVESKLHYDRYCRECEEKVKRELEQLVKADINIFTQRTSVERYWLLNKLAA